MPALRASADRPAVLVAGLTLLANGLALVLFERSPGLVLAALLLAGVVAAALARPGVVLCAVAFGVVASADLLDLVYTLPALGVAGFRLQLTDLFLLVALLALAATVARGDGTPALPALVREPAFAAFLPLALLAGWDLARGGHGTLSSARIFLYCVAVPLVVRTVATPRAFRVLGRSVVAAAVVASLAGVALTAAGRSVTASDLSTGGARGVSIGASFLVAGALVGVLAGVVSGARSPGLGSAAVVLALLGGVVASGARETWIGVGAALALFALVSALRGFLRLALVLALAGLIAGGAYTILPHPAKLDATLAAVEQRLASASPEAAVHDPSVQVRYEKWSVVWDQLRAHPWFGTGFGFPATYTSNIGGSNFVRAYVDDPENTQLWLWARMGTVGFAAWVAFNLLALGTAVVRFVRARGGAARTAELWAAGILLVVWSGMCFSPVSAFASTLLLYWLAVALVTVGARLEEEPGR